MPLLLLFDVLLISLPLVNPNLTKGKKAQKMQFVESRAEKGG